MASPETKWREDGSADVRFDIEAEDADTAKRDAEALLRQRATKAKLFEVVGANYTLDVTALAP